MISIQTAILLLTGTVVTAIIVLWLLDWSLQRSAADAAAECQDDFHLAMQRKIARDKALGQ